MITFKPLKNSKYKLYSMQNIYMNVCLQFIFYQSKCIYNFSPRNIMTYDMLSDFDYSHCDKIKKRNSITEL